MFTFHRVFPDLLSSIICPGWDDLRQSTFLISFLAHYHLSAGLPSSHLNLASALKEFLSHSPLSTKLKRKKFCLILKDVFITFQ